MTGRVTLMTLSLLSGKWVVVLIRKQGPREARALRARHLASGTPAPQVVWMPCAPEGRTWFAVRLRSPCECYSCRISFYLITKIKLLHLEKAKKGVKNSFVRFYLSPCPTSLCVLAIGLIVLCLHFVFSQCAEF